VNPQDRRGFLKSSGEVVNFGDGQGRQVTLLFHIRTRLFHIRTRLCCTLLFI
jgi:hypothetical protein